MIFKAVQFELLRIFCFTKTSGMSRCEDLVVFLATLDLQVSLGPILECDQV